MKLLTLCALPVFNWPMPMVRKWKGTKLSALPWRKYKALINSNCTPRPRYCFPALADLTLRWCPAPLRSWLLTSCSTPQVKTACWAGKRSSHTRSLQQLKRDAAEDYGKPLSNGITFHQDGTPCTVVMYRILVFHDQTSTQVRRTQQKEDDGLLVKCSFQERVDWFRHANVSTRLA